MRYHIKLSEGELMRLRALIESIESDVTEHFKSRNQGENVNIVVEPQVDGRDMTILTGIKNQINAKIGEF